MILESRGTFYQENRTEVEIHELLCLHITYSPLLYHVLSCLYYDSRPDKRDVVAASLLYVYRHEWYHIYKWM